MPAEPPYAASAAIDAVWSLRTSIVGQPNFFVTGGIVTLDAGRLTGGDNHVAYAGRYALDGAALSGALRVWTWNQGRLDARNVFGLPLPFEIRLMLTGTFAATRIEAKLHIADADIPPISARLDRISPLP